MTAIPRPYSVIFPKWPEKAIPVIAMDGKDALVPEPGTEKLIWMSLKGATLGILCYPGNEVIEPPWAESFHSPEDSHDAIA